MIVPVVSRRVVDDDPAMHHVTAQEFEVALSLRDGSGETWVYLGAGPNEYVEVSLGTAVDLLRVLEATVWWGRDFRSDAMVDDDIRPPAAGLDPGG